MAGQPATFEDTSTYPDGIARTVLTTYVPQLAVEGQVNGFYVFVTDITERKQAEDALKESERKFHDVIEKSTDGIALSDESGHIIEFNDAFEHLSGYKRKDVLGKFLWDFAFDLMPEQPNTEEYFNHMKRDIEDALQGDASSSFQLTKEVSFQRPDNSLIHVQLRLFSIPTEIGRRLGCISRDITQIKEAEENLKTQNRNLHSLYQMTATLNKIVAIEDIYTAALDSLQDTLQADRVSILLFDADGVMRFKAWRGLSDAYRNAAEGHSPWKQDAVDPQPVLVPDFRQDTSLTALAPIFEKEGIGALGFIPLIHQGRLLGKFMIYFNFLRPLRIMWRLPLIANEQTMPCKPVKSVIVFCMKIIHPCISRQMRTV